LRSYGARYYAADRRPAKDIEAVSGAALEPSDLAPGLLLGAGVTIGDGVMIGGHAIIHAGVTIGDGARIGDHAQIRDGAAIGPGATVGSLSSIDPDVVLGARASVQARCYLSAGTVVEEDVFIGPGVTLANDNTMDRHGPELSLAGPLLRRACRVGAGVVVCPAIEIGEEAFVAAGAVVAADVAPRSVVMGVPARHAREVPDGDLLECWR
jgi:acetyltransferase-like isoleucine patch superfamily enzyme